MALHELESFDSAAQAKRNLRAAIEKVAGRLVIGPNGVDTR
jgi:DNA topoisomerase-1